MTKDLVHVGIVQYPGALLSAVQGLTEQFYLANTICRQHERGDVFRAQTFDALDLARARSAELPPLQVVILPPCLDDSYYTAPHPGLIEWLRRQHGNGAIVCSVCAGAFVLAETGLLDGRRVTTHWALADDFSGRYPRIGLDIHRLLINDVDIITAGGLMSWIDLGLELVAQFSSAQIMRQLGKYLIVDTGSREQSYYQSFSPKLDHGDEAIIKAQHHLQRCFQEALTIKQLAALAHLTERTFLRRFVKATGLKPTQYLQQLRVQKACEMIESSGEAIERIALYVGYEDLSAFRRTFSKLTGQTPKEFRKRFAR